MGEGVCPSRSVRLAAEAALGSVGMEKKGIPLTAHTVQVTGRYEQGTSLCLSYIPRLHVTDQPGRNTLKEKKLQCFETILRASEYRWFMQTLDKVFIPWEPLIGKSSLHHPSQSSLRARWNGIWQNLQYAHYTVWGHLGLLPCFPVHWNLSVSMFIARRLPCHFCSCLWQKEFNF